MVEEKELAFDREEIVEQDHQTYLQLDLKRNRWITAFSTLYHFDSRGYFQTKIGAYKLYVAVDEEDKDRRLFGIETVLENSGSKRKKHAARKAYTVKTAKNERSKRRRERRQLDKEASGNMSVLLTARSTTTFTTSPRIFGRTRRTRWHMDRIMTTTTTTR